MSDTSKIKITYFSKSPTVCPVCLTRFFKEELLSGGGRLIAGDLTDELHRLYEPSKKFGELYPLVYTIVVCPSCYYAAYPQDFTEVGKQAVKELKNDTDRRLESMALILDGLNFAEFRDLKEGAASYYLAIMSYDFFESNLFPTFKRGLSALRTAWLFNDLHTKYFGENYDYLALLFYRKARFYYLMAIDRAQNGEELLDAKINYGPDLDKNFTYEGFLYIAGLLEYKYGPKKDPEKRLKTLEGAKRIVSRIFGTGKASKSKPSAILEKAKALYDLMNKEIKALKGEG